jgi:hypothetical protein
MSTDSKLKNYNAVMIMKDENTADKYPRQRILIHEQDLEFQQKDLFWAFVDGDRNYIYPFDDETMKKRDNFLNKAFQIGFTAVVTLGASNYLFFKQIRPQTIYSNAVKLTLLATVNLIPLGIFSYQGLILYNKTNDFLYEKYLKK